MSIIFGIFETFCIFNNYLLDINININIIYINFDERMIYFKTGYT